MLYLTFHPSKKNSMIRFTIFFVLLFTIAAHPFAFGQVDSVALREEVRSFQEELNKEYKDLTTTPLTSAALRKFKGHLFFPVDLSYRVQARLELTPNTSFSLMKATGSVLQEYRTYANAVFTLNGETFTLPVYQSKSLMRTAGYEDYLFCPFTDLTTGHESYDGGRYVEVRIPKEGDVAIIDFNKAYNPYCAYNDKYSCPLVPPQNHLAVAIKAGVRMKK
jgi:uncharacterized protein (DUF1684 family)